ncbi:hypothetical protein ACFL26_01490 [Patescibacteria group bacterium]
MAERPKLDDAERAELLAALEKRRESSRRKPRIRNEMLRAGAPVFFYCIGCGCNHATLQENYIMPPPRLCRDCKKLYVHGLHDVDPYYVDCEPWILPPELR